MRFKVWSIFNLLITLLLIYWNYLSNTGAINGETIGSLSTKYDNLFVPATYAFSIWGLIFLGLLIYGVNAIYLAFTGKSYDKTGLEALPWLCLVNLFNGLWVWLWLNEMLLLSVIVMLIILLSLLKIVFVLRLEIWDAPMKTIALIWWPMDIYVGWIAVATVANVSAYLSTIEFSLGLKESSWVIIMIVVVTIINFLMVTKRNMREFALVGIWALAAIAVRHWGEIPTIQWTAVLACLFLFIVNSIHAKRNKATLPFIAKKWNE